MPPDNTLIVGLPIAILGAICLFSVVTIVLTVGLIIVLRRVLGQALNLEPDAVVLQQGTAAKAKIISIQQTGVWLHHDPQVSLQLEVYPPYGTSYTATTKAVIPLVNVPQYQPGTEAAVKIHPTDPSKVELDRIP